MKKTKKLLKHVLPFWMAFISYTAVFGQHNINYPNDTVLFCIGDTVAINYTPAGINGISGDSIFFVHENNDTIYGGMDTLKLAYINGGVKVILADNSTRPLPSVNSYTSYNDDVFYLVKGQKLFFPGDQMMGTPDVTICTIDTYYDTIVIGAVYDTATIYHFHTTYDPAPAPTFAAEPICMVTVDTLTGQNMIVWEQTAPRAQAYKIFKLNDQTSQYDSVAIVSSDSMSVFIDVNSNPAQQSASYKISALDTFSITTTIHDTTIFSVCNGGAIMTYDTVYVDEYIDWSAQSDEHKTIHLTANIGIAEEVNLIWNAYTGFPYATHAIYLSNNGGAWTLIGNTANSVTSYTDNTHPAGVNRYFVSVTNPNGCNPSERTISSTMSNLFQHTSLTTGVADFAKTNVAVYPNPASNIITIQSSERLENVSIYNVVGMLVQQENTNEFSVQQLAAGVYTFKITTAKGTSVVRVVKE